MTNFKCTSSQPIMIAPKTQKRKINNHRILGYFTRWSFFFLTLIFLSASADLLGQSVRTQRMTSLGSISGRVTTDGKPAASIKVVAYRLNNGAAFGFELTPQHRPIPQSVTDKNGYYRISNLPPGDYSTLPEMPGFVVKNSPPPGQPWRVKVEEGKNTDKINFDLTRGGVITGRVMDAAGKPVAAARLDCHWYIPTFEQWASGCGLQPVTDDRGIYRFFGLKAGKYRVLSTDEVHPWTYSPDVTDERKARVVDVELGVEISNVDIRYGRALNSYSVSGRLVDGATAAPLANFSVLLDGGETERNPRFGPTKNRDLTDVEGRFKFTGLTQGKHTVTIESNEVSGDYFADILPIEIDTEDSKGLELKAYRGATVRGRFLIEGTRDPNVKHQMTELNLLASTFMPSGFNASSTPGFQVSEDGQFRLSGIRPGLVRIQEWNWPTGFLLMRIEYQGKALTDTLSLDSAQEVTGLQVIAAYGVGAIQLQVERNGSPYRGGGGMLFISRVDKPGRFLCSPVNALDSNGRFQLRGLPTGEYSIMFRFYKGMNPGDGSLSAQQLLHINGDDATPVNVVLSLQEE